MKWFSKFLKWLSFTIFTWSILEYFAPCIWIFLSDTQNSCHFVENVTSSPISCHSFYTTWKHQKTRGFLMCSGGTKRDQWREMGYCSNQVRVSSSNFVSNIRRIRANLSTSIFPEITRKLISGGMHVHLTRFSQILHFYTPWKHQKTKEFPTFSEDIELEHWANIRSKIWRRSGRFYDLYKVDWKKLLNLPLDTDLSN